MSDLEALYLSANPKSAAAHQDAVKLIPSGVNHDARLLAPFPCRFVSGHGSRKWDVDDHEYIDYVMGHGSLIFGHSDPDLISAVTKQIGTMSHSAGCNPQEVAWAQLIADMVPNAEQVRFTMSGTEATMLAIRVARAATSREEIIRVQGHFHGWHDYAAFGLFPPYDESRSGGVPTATPDTVRVVRDRDLKDLERALAEGDVAGVLIEAGGAGSGAVPMKGEYLRGVEKLVRSYGSLLILDEVITGFRYSPGGAQEVFHVDADLITLGKVVAGGLPGGALVGRRDEMRFLSDGADLEQHGRTLAKKVWHSGTWNANPLSATAGVATLSKLKSGDVQREAERKAVRLRRMLNEAIRETGVRGSVYGESSCLRIILGDDLLDAFPEEIEHVTTIDRLRSGIQSPLKQKLALAEIVSGIDFLEASYGWVSAAHSEADLETTAERFGRCLHLLVEEGVLTRARR